MRLGIDQDIGRRPALDEDLQKAPNARTVLTARSELAVGEKPGAAFAVEHIALDIERSVFPKILHSLGARRSGFAAFNHQRFHARLSQRESGHQSGRTGADHDGAQAGKIIRHGFYDRNNRLRFFDIAQAVAQFTGEIGLGHHRHARRTTARIDGAAHRLHAVQIRRIAAHLFRGGLQQLLRRVARRQINLGDSYFHSSTIMA